MNMDGWGGVLGDGMRKPSSQMSKSELGLALVPRVGDLAFSGWIYNETGSFNLVILQNYLFFFFKEYSGLKLGPPTCLADTHL